MPKSQDRPTPPEQVKNHPKRKGFEGDQDLLNWIRHDLNRLSMINNFRRAFGVDPASMPVDLESYREGLDKAERLRFIQAGIEVTKTELFRMSPDMDRIKRVGLEVISLSSGEYSRDEEVQRYASEFFNSGIDFARIHSSEKAP